MIQFPYGIADFYRIRRQGRVYRAALLKREGELNLRSYAIVAVGLERILGQEIEPD